MARQGTPLGSLLPFSNPSTTTPQKKTRFVTQGSDEVDFAGFQSSPVERGITFRGEVLRAIKRNERNSLSSFRTGQAKEPQLIESQQCSLFVCVFQTRRHVTINSVTVIRIQVNVQSLARIDGVSFVYAVQRTHITRTCTTHRIPVSLQRCRCTRALYFIFLF